MKWILIVVAAIVVIGGGVGAYVVLSGNSDDSNQISQTSSNSSSESSIKDLLTQGKSVKCSYSVSAGGGTVSGTVFVASSKKLYGEFQTVTDSKSTETRIIRDGDNQYIWEQGKITGYKSNVSVAESSKEGESASTSQTIDTAKKYDFHCSSWNVDESKFTLPSNVTFKDLSAQLNQVKTGANTVKNIAICNAISDGTAKQACLDAIKNQ